MRGRGVYNSRGTVGNTGERNGNVGQVGIRKVAFDKCLINNAMCQKQKKRKC